MSRNILITIFILITVLVTAEAQKKPLSVYKFDFGSGKAAKGYNAVLPATIYNDAYEIARCIVNGIRENIPELAAHLKKNIKPFNPATPDPVEEWRWPLIKRGPAIKPDGN